MPPELARSGVRRVGVGLLCAKIALVPLVFDAAADQSFTLPKALLSHGLAYALVIAMLAVVVQFRRAALMRSPIHLPVLAFLGANILATIVAPDAHLALFGNHGRMLGLGTIADWVVLYFAFVLLARTHGEQLTVLAFAILPTPLIVGYEYVQAAGRDPFSWSTGNTERPFSTFGLSTALGEYLVILVSGLIVVAALLPRLARWQRITLFVWSGVLVVAAFRTGTRSVLLGAVAAAAVIGVVLWTQTASRRGRIIVLALGGIGAVALALAVVLTPLGQRITSTLAAGQGGSIEVDPSTAGRLDLYRIALDMFQTRPLLGYGPDSFAAGVPTFRPDPADPLVRQSLATSAHGWIWYVVTGSGVLGLASFLAVIALAGSVLFRGATPVLGLAGAAVAVAFLGSGLLSVDDVNVDWLFWLGIALVASSGATPLAPPEVREKAKGSRRTRQKAVVRHGPANLGWIASAIAIASLLVIVPAWSASRAAKTSADLRLTGKVHEATSAGLAAVGQDGGRAEYWHTLAFSYIAAQRYRDADAALAQAVRLSPYDVLLVGDEVKVNLVLAQQGDSTAQARALELSLGAVRMDPNNPRAQLLRATALQATGDVKGAQPFVRRALALDPGSQNEALYVTAVEILTADGEGEDAVAIARAALPLLPATAVGLRFELARTLLVLGRPSEALREVDAVLVMMPSLKDAQDLRAQIVAAMR